MTYRYEPNAVLSTVTHLVDFLDAVTIPDMIATFGTPPESYEDSEKGYDGREWKFVGVGRRVFNVYARWGVLRIGAAANDVSDVHDFKGWLLAQVGR